MKPLFISIALLLSFHLVANAQKVFDNETVTNANFVDDDYSNSSWKNATLSNVYISANFTGATFDEAELTNIMMSEANFTGATFKGATIKYFNSDEEAPSNFDSANFSNANIYKAVWTNCSLRNATFENATLLNVGFIGSDLSATSFKGATITAGDFRNVKNAGTSLLNDCKSLVTVVSTDGTLINPVFNNTNFDSQNVTIDGLDEICEVGLTPNDLISIKIKSDTTLRNSSLYILDKIEISNNATLTVDRTSSFGMIYYFNVKEEEYKDSYDLISSITIKSGSKIVFEDGAKFYVILDAEIKEGTSVTLLEWENDVNIVGLDSLLNNNNLIIQQDIAGSYVTFDKPYSIDINDDSLVLTIVPEPSTYALIFAILALAFTAYRKRK